MDQPIAELITQDDKAPLLIEKLGRWSATRFYRINTHDEARGASALALPRYGDPYPESAQLGVTDLVVTGREIRYTHGTDDAATGVGGWCEARVDYEQSALGGDLPGPTTKFSEIECNVTSVHVTQGLDDMDLTTGAFANGRGASKDTGGTLLRVTTYLMPEAFVGMLSRLIALQAGQKYNLEEIAAPPLKGSRTPLPIPAGYAQYYSYRTEYVGAAGGMLALVHTLKISPDGYKVQWRKINELSTPIGPVLSTPIYERADFAGLW